MPQSILFRSVFIWFLPVAVALVSWRFLVADIAVVMAGMQHQLADAKAAFYAHIIFAPVALALLPFQLTPRLRAARPALHRWLGRFYGLAILISGVAGLFIAPNAATGAVAATGFFALSLAWLVTTAVAIWHAINRRISRHREWIIRSAALTLAAVTLRIYLPVGMATVGFEASYPLIAWLCWVPNLLVAEWWLRRRPAVQTA